MKLQKLSPFKEYISQGYLLSVRYSLCVCANITASAVIHLKKEIIQISYCSVSIVVIVDMGLMFTRGDIRTAEESSIIIIIVNIIICVIKIMMVMIMMMMTITRDDLCADEATVRSLVQAWSCNPSPPATKYPKYANWRFDNKCW